MIFGWEPFWSYIQSYPIITFYPSRFHATLKYTPATGGGCELDDENRMPSHRGLLSVILGEIRGIPGINKLKRMRFDGFETFGSYVISVFLC
jgi:hypothetical protein